MSVNAYGKCVHWGRANLMITIGVHIHDIHETVGSEAMVPGVCQGKRKRGQASKEIT